MIFLTEKTSIKTRAKNLKKKKKKGYIGVY